MGVAMNVAYKNEIVNPTENTTYTDEIGLIYVSDYGYATMPNYWGNTLNNYDRAISSNWMYIGLDEWTITRLIEDELRLPFIALLNTTGTFYNQASYADGLGFGVRPTFYLKPTVKYAGVGNGTKQNPYRLVEPQIINFTVNQVDFNTGKLTGSKSYQAEDSMTWVEWVESNYNDYYFIFDDHIIDNSSYRLLYDLISKSNVEIKDIIIDNYVYIKTGSAGGDFGWQ